MMLNKSTVPLNVKNKMSKVKKKSATVIKRETQHPDSNIKLLWRS